jgi:hypothetical protein
VLAGARVHNAVFLVVPDTALLHLLPFQGVAGVPVLRLLGPLTIGGGTGARPGGVTPLAFVDGNPVVQAEFRRRPVSCRLDTGASRSSFSPRVAAAVPPAGPAPPQRVTQEVMGSAHTTTMYETSLAFSLAGRSVLLRRALVVEASRGGRDVASCTLAADAIAALAPVSIDFGRMSLVLH